MRGRDKLAETIDGKPLLRLMAERALAAGAPVIAVLRPGMGRAALLDGLALTITSAEGEMSDSLRAGLAAAGQAPGALILPADMPLITEAALRAALDLGRAHPGRVIRACDVQGRWGHPVLLPRRIWPALDALSGDQGARPLLAQEEALPLPLPGDMAQCDLDTPEDWAAWRAAHRPSPA